MSTTRPSIAVIGGTGDLGSGIASRLARAGYPVVIGSRSAEKAEAAAKELAGGKARGMANAAAAAAADVVLLAVPFASHDGTLADIASGAAGKLFIDTTVPLMPPKVGPVQLPAVGSAGQAAQNLLGEGVKVVSAFQNVAAHQSNDEFKELGDSFNYMTGRMSMLFAEVSGKKEELHSIISSIQEGLLVLDRKGKIILSNESMKKIFLGATFDGKLYWEVIREPQFSDLINRVMNEKKSHTDEIALNDKTFSCSATSLGAHEEIVILFHDITASKKLEKIKKDFVVNVSHELRTPLTAIKGFVETMEEDIDNKNRNYLSIISRNTERLINIVEDLLPTMPTSSPGAR